ncbi:hypothetical protein CFAM422_006947 [Trichoderma lentiforme]|uniref:Uncharacterized protein n=1 Tax=Trichoderma lentiforme TaxID=1567552 RepID=A0A9P4XCM0_9HYPO|nr:hypothetical protein CFAM422_006947 [Trichoderma lentiforme]
MFRNGGIRRSQMKANKRAQRPGMQPTCCLRLETNPAKETFAHINLEDRLLTPEYSYAGGKAIHLVRGLIRLPPPREEIPKQFHGLTPPQLATADSLYGQGKHVPDPKEQDRLRPERMKGTFLYLYLLYTQVHGPSYQFLAKPDRLPQAASSRSDGIGDLHFPA